MIYMRQKRKPRELTTVSSLRCRSLGGSLEVPGWSAFFSLHESPLCIMHEFFVFLLCLVGGIELHLDHFVLK